MLGFGGGVMLAATSLSLIRPRYHAAIEQGFPKSGAAQLWLWVFRLVSQLLTSIFPRALP